MRKHKPQQKTKRKNIQNNPYSNRKRGATIMQIAILASSSAGAIGAVIIGVLFYYHKETPVVWTVFGTIVFITLAFCLTWQNKIFEKQKSMSKSEKTEIPLNAPQKRPTFIKATNVKGLTIEGNKVSGDVDFSDLKNIDGLHISGNKHNVPKTPPSKK